MARLTLLISWYFFLINVVIYTYLQDRTTVFSNTRTMCGMLPKICQKTYLLFLFFTCIYLSLPHTQITQMPWLYGQTTISSFAEPLWKTESRDGYMVDPLVDSDQCKGEFPKTCSSARNRYRHVNYPNKTYREAVPQKGPTWKKKHQDRYVFKLYPFWVVSYK